MIYSVLALSGGQPARQMSCQIVRGLTVLSVAGTGELYTWGWGKSCFASVMVKPRGVEGRRRATLTRGWAGTEELCSSPSLEQV